MREILFKAKRLNSNTWVEGYYVKINNLHLIYYDNEVSNGYTEIDPETLCQFTGLIDKNKKEIWENDIVSAVWYSYIEPLDEITGVVKYFTGYGMYMIFDEKNRKKEELNGCGAYTHEFEVLGNVFDNPELIYDED